MRRANTLALLVLLVLPVAPTPLARAAGGYVVDGRVDDWLAPSPLVAGATSIVDGELVHQDHIYDDTGASGNRTARQHSSTPRSTSAGHFRYPLDPERYADNAADLFQVRLAVDGDEVVALARLNALRQPDSTVVSLAFDVDGGDDRRPWPHGGGVVAAGVDVVVTMWGTGATVADLRTGATAPLEDVAVSTDDNAIEAAFPAASLAGPGPIRMWATSGLWDEGAGTYRAVPLTAPTATAPGNGSPLVTSRVWNAAFRSAEEGPFQDDRQAPALAAGDVTPFSFAFDWSDLQSGADRPWTPTPGTFYVALLDTGVAIPPLGEGVSYDGVPGRFPGIGGSILNQQFSFLGRYQPYGLYLPSSWDGRTPLPAALVLHGHGSSHVSYNQFPGFLEDFGEHPPTVLVTPLARGSSFYADYGEHEVLEVLDDIERRWSIDPERLYLTGYSMGGYGVYRLGSLYPDRFAGAVAWAGYSGEFTGLPHGEAGSGIASGERDTTPTGDAVRNLESFLHLPVLHLTGTNDEVVPVTGQLAASRRLDELGYRYRLDVYPGYEHLSFGIVDDWSQPRAWLGDARRQSSPRDIALAVSDGWRSAGLQPMLSLPGASAWWLTTVVQRDGRDEPLVNGIVRATSRALPGQLHTVERTAEVGTQPTPHTRTGIAWTSGPAATISNALDLSLRNIGRVDVDLAGARLVADRLDVVVDADGPSSVVLARASGDPHGLAVTASPRGASGSVDGDLITLQVPGPGRWSFSIAASAPAPVEPTAPTSLPATGVERRFREAFVLLAAAFAARWLTLAARRAQPM